MHYSYEITVSSTDSVDDPLIFPVKLASGIIKTVEIYFPLGCRRTVRCSLFDRAAQVLPSNADGFYSLDGDTVRANLHYDMDAKDNILYLVAWSIGSVYDHTLTLHIEVQGKDEPDLQSLMVLMTQTIDRLISLCRSLL